MHFVGYYTRPLWDKPDAPFTVINHFFTPNMSISNAQWCSLHGWYEYGHPTPRTTGSFHFLLRSPLNNQKDKDGSLTNGRNTTQSKQQSTMHIQPRQVVDAVIFSIELDLLEIRIRELEHVVDKFVILESNGTFSGEPKELVFAKNRNRFNFISPDRIISDIIPLYPLSRHQGPFDNERRMRGAMTSLLGSERVGLKEGDLVLMSDTDEIIASHVVQLLKTCDGYPDSLHLQMRNYIYSFEFPYDMLHWRPHVERWHPSSTFYHHSRSSHDEFMLADAGKTVFIENSTIISFSSLVGWHCSFCFRYIEDFIFKMKSYSHNDRVRYPKLLLPERIQKVICRGDDIFDMLPEAFTFREFISKWGPIPRSQSAIGLPNCIVNNVEKFRFLLPGGCVREQKQR